jgi:hypothetical protein
MTTLFIYWYLLAKTCLRGYIVISDVFVLVWPYIYHYAEGYNET